MDTILLNYGLPGVVIIALSTVCAKLYSDNKALIASVEKLSQARVDDLKEINAAKDTAGAQLAQMVTLIYNKLESEQRGK